jgi:hypothetical protein
LIGGEVCITKREMLLWSIQLTIRCISEDFVTLLGSQSIDTGIYIEAPTDIVMTLLRSAEFRFKWLDSTIARRAKVSAILSSNGASSVKG